jgi:cytochrome o ubiquinol oxidase subunit IV
MSKTVGSVRSYTFGFSLSIIMTIASFGIYSFYQNSQQFMPVEIYIALLISLAVLQLFVQLIFFLHLGHEKGPRWNLVFLLSTVSIFIMVVVGSIWIMYHLNYNMMPPENVEEFIIHDEGMQMR